MRRVMVGAILLLLLLPLTACSSSSDSSATGAGATSSAGGGEGAKTAADGATSGGRTAATGTSKGGDSTASEAGPAVTRKLPRAQSEIAYAVSKAGAQARSRFARASRPLRNTYSSVQVYTASSGGVAKADIAVYTFPAETAKDPRFQGQIVSQLVSASTGVSKLRYENLRGRSAAVAAGKISGVGYFDVDKAVVVLSRPTRTAGSGVSNAANVAYSYSK